MNTKEMIEVMQAEQSGEKIQYKPRQYSGEWTDIIDPSWEWGTNQYRIKPTPTYRPYRPDELMQLKGKWLKAKNNSSVSLVTDLVESSGVAIKGTYRSLNELFHYWTHEDGSVCGVLEE